MVEADRQWRALARRVILGEVPSVEAAPELARLHKRARRQETNAERARRKLEREIDDAPTADAMRWSPARDDDNPACR